MGAQLALQAHAFANTANLSTVPRLLLWWMATRALDEDSTSGQRARRSFMARPELAFGLGRMMADRQPSADAPKADRDEWERHDQAVKRALTELKRAGAITLVRAGHSGRSSEYEITLRRPAASTATVPLLGTENVPVGGRSLTKKGDHETSPQGEEINHEKKQGEQPQAPATTHVHPVDKNADEMSTRPSRPRSERPPAPRPSPFNGARRILEHQNAAS